MDTFLILFQFAVHGVVGGLVQQPAENLHGLKLAEIQTGVNIFKKFLFYLEQFFFVILEINLWVIIEKNHVMFLPVSSTVVGLVGALGEAAQKLVVLDQEHQ